MHNKGGLSLRSIDRLCDVVRVAGVPPLDPELASVIESWPTLHLRQPT